MSIFDRFKAAISASKDADKAKFMTSSEPEERLGKANVSAGENINPDQYAKLLGHIGPITQVSYRTRSMLFLSNNMPNSHVSGRKITVSFDPVSGEPRILEDSVDDPSTIYVQLPIVVPNDSISVPKPDYFPSYSGLTPEQRYVYLKWLTDVSKSVDVGYLFVYYYGLERHLIFGKFDDAVDEILLLRNHHLNKSFQSYSSSALIHACLLRSRQDRLAEILEKASPEGLLNSELLLALKSKIDLSAECIIRASSQIKDTNRRYIRSHQDQYISALREVLLAKFDKPYLPFSSKYVIDKLPKEGSNIFANISFPDYLRSPLLPNFYGYKPFVKELSAIYCEAHELAKARIAETRKAKLIKAS